MLEQSMGYQLKRAQHALRTQMDLALREIGLTAPQYAALNALKERPGLSGASLARRCFVTPQTMNTIVTNLEEAGLLVRRCHPEHGRVLQAYMTPPAEALLQEGHRRVSVIEKRMAAAISHDQLLQLTEALRACADALEESSNETSSLL
jgi:DNA-binding MarR family transcriptional regulator